MLPEEHCTKTGEHVLEVLCTKYPGGDVPGYVPTPEYLRPWEVYGDWVNGNPGTHLDGGVADTRVWQGWWSDLAVMPSRRYEAPSRKVGRRFVNALLGELRGVCDRRWNSGASPSGRQ